MHAGGAPRVNFLHESDRIEHDSVANHAAATLPQHTARDELQDKLLAVDGDRVSRIMTAGITRHNLEALGQNVNDFAFAFVAPLRSDYDCRLSSFQIATPIAIREIVACRPSASKRRVEQAFRPASEPADLLFHPLRSATSADETTSRTAVGRKPEGLLYPDRTPHAKYALINPADHADSHTTRLSLVKQSLSSGKWL
jgi:hypothetical protein